MDNDKFIFADEPPDSNPDTAALPGASWKLLIVDDEEDVHRATELVLGDFEFEGRNLEFFSAYSAEEAKELFLAHPDMAIILLDVVMETSQAGLEMARWVREEVGNRFVRIVLRTGQPGQAPEQEVITRYDINDYKQKSELTAQRLFTTMTTALRCFRDLRIIEMNRLGLEQIVAASADLFHVQSVRRLARGILTQLTSLVGLRSDSVYVQAAGFAAREDEGSLRIVAGTGRFSGCVDGPMDACPQIPDAIMAQIRHAAATGQSLFLDKAYIGHFPNGAGLINIVYIEGTVPFGKELNEQLIGIFSNNVGIALENIRLNREIVETQREVVQKLGEVVENRFKESASHIRRMVEYSRILGRAVNLTEEQVSTLTLAMPLHDVGKIAIPDDVLLKPGRLSGAEREVIKNHARMGHDILRSSNRPILRKAAIIALQHHEHWDGGGYPDGLSGEDIHIFGRIAAVADVFDALATRRPHKEPWDLGKILDYFRNQTGRQFDPDLVGALFHHLDDCINVLEQYSGHNETA